MSEWFQVGWFDLNHHVVTPHCSISSRIKIHVCQALLNVCLVPIKSMHIAV